MQGTLDGNDVRYSSDSLTTGDFQLERHINVAVKMLALDPNLAKVHSRLISSMAETTFWNHYFSRVAALRAEVGLEPLCEDVRKVRLHVMSFFCFTCSCNRLTCVRSCLWKEVIIPLPSSRSAPNVCSAD